MTISHTVKAKRRQQAAETRAIADALWACVPLDAGTDEYDGRLTCHALNEQAGFAYIDMCAQDIARFPRGSEARAGRAWDWAGTSNLVAALGYSTPAFALATAGLL